MAALKDPETPLHLRGFVMISLHTGQLGVHVRNLKWSDVDFDEGWLYFTRSNPDAADNKQCADMVVTRGLAPVLLELQAAARPPARRSPAGPDPPRRRLVPAPRR